MDWWVLELMWFAGMVFLALWLGPFIRRFGKSYAADVFRANPRTGKSFIVLMDVAYYLIFFAFILFTVQFEPDTDWGQTVNADQLQACTVRLGGILLIVGVLHGLNVLMLPIIGRILTLNRRLDERRRRPRRRTQSAARIATDVRRRSATGRRSAPSSSVRRPRRLSSRLVSALLLDPDWQLGAATTAAEPRSLGPEVTIEADDDQRRSRRRTTSSTSSLPAPCCGSTWSGSSRSRVPSPSSARRACTRRCGNQIPVQFDENGDARFQYLVTDDFVGGATGAGRLPGRRGAVHGRRARVDGDAAGGEIQTIFGDAIPPPGGSTVTPSRGLSLDGETVTVDGPRLPARRRRDRDALRGTGRDRAALRRARARPRRSSSAATAPVARELVVEPGRVGRDGRACARGDDCGISVASDDVFARAPVVPISFAAPPGRRLRPDPARARARPRGAARRDRGVADPAHRLVGRRRGRGARDRRRGVRRPRRDHRRAASRGGRRLVPTR